MSSSDTTSPPALPPSGPPRRGDDAAWKGVLAGVQWQIAGVALGLAGVLLACLFGVALRGTYRASDELASFMLLVALASVIVGWLSTLIGMMHCFAAPAEGSLRIYAVAAVAASIWGFTMFVDNSFALFGRFGNGYTEAYVPGRIASAGIFALLGWALNMCFIGVIARRFNDPPLNAGTHHNMIFQVGCVGLLIVSVPLARGLSVMTHDSMIVTALYVTTVCSMFTVSVVWYIKLLMGARRLLRAELGLEVARPPEPTTQIDWGTPTTKPAMRASPEERSAKLMENTPPQPQSDSGPSPP